MKYFILSLLLISQCLWATGLDDFISMNDSEKMNYLNANSEEIYAKAEIEKFERQNPEFAEKVQEIGHDRSRVWGDTVLEGPYAQTGDVKVSISSLYFIKGELYAIRAVARADAIFLDLYDCEYNYDLDQWIGDCLEGYIYENFYLDFKGNFIESYEYADFDS